MVRVTNLRGLLPMLFAYYLICLVASSEINLFNWENYNIWLKHNMIYSKDYD
jgi:hypothetical protein